MMSSLPKSTDVTFFARPTVPFRSPFCLSRTDLEQSEHKNTRTHKTRGVKVAQLVLRSADALIVVNRLPAPSFEPDDLSATSQPWANAHADTQTVPECSRASLVCWIRYESEKEAEVDVFVRILRDVA